MPNPPQSQPANGGLFTAWRAHSESQWDPWQRFVVDPDTPAEMWAKFIDRSAPQGWA